MRKLIFLFITGFISLLFVGGVFSPPKAEGEPLIPLKQENKNQAPSIVSEPIRESVDDFSAEIPVMAVEEPVATTKQTATSSEEIILPESVVLNIPFIVQAPLGKWSDERQQNGCEEASALMTILWIKEETMTPKQAEKEIIAISDYQTKQYGDFHETSAQDTIDRIFKGYFKYENVVVKYDVIAEDIKRELALGNAVIAYVNGQKVKNPFYTRPGPIDHVLVVTGYDSAAREFITNDPGTKHGGGFRYDEDVFVGALRDYPTGFHEELDPQDERRAIIVVSREN